jgi:S-DNA-T family DNA segregation ATPase FtsK/SpoIIIE
LAKSQSELKPELKYELFGIALVTVAVLTIASLAGLNTGPAGVFTAKILRYAFGAGAFIPPLLLLAVGSRYVWTRKAVRYSLKFWGLVLVYVTALAIFHHFRIPVNQEVLPESLTPGGGLVGGMVLFSLRKLFGVSGSLIVLSAVGLASLLLATPLSLGATLLAARNKASEGLQNAKQAVACTLENARAEADEDDGGVSSTRTGTSRRFSRLPRRPPNPNPNRPRPCGWWRSPPRSPCLRRSRLPITRCRRSRC